MCSTIDRLQGHYHDWSLFSVGDQAAGIRQHMKARNSRMLFKFCPVRSKAWTSRAIWSRDKNANTIGDRTWEEAGYHAE